MTVEFRRGRPANAGEVARTEAALGFSLAPQFRRFVSYYDGASPKPSIFAVPGEGEASLQLFFPVTEIPHWKALIEGFPQGASYPIGITGTGDVLFMRAQDQSVYFWDHEAGGGGARIADSFDSFLAGLHALRPQGQR